MKGALGAFLRWLGDWCFELAWDRPADRLYKWARRLGARMEWP